MVKFRIWIGILVWWLFLFYNIERINEPINIASFVYVLVPVAAGMLILVPRAFARRRLLIILIPTLAIYFALKVYLEYPILGQGLPLTVTELVSLLITLLLVQQVGTIVWDVEDTMDKVTFHQIGLPPRLYESADTEDLYREVKRSRRFGHPLSILFVEPDLSRERLDVNRTLIEMQKNMVERFTQARVAKMLSEELRDCDLIAAHEQGFAILLPETHQTHAVEVARRLSSRVADKLNVELNIGISGFPDAALTLGGLLDSALAHKKTYHPVTLPPGIEIPEPAGAAALVGYSHNDDHHDDGHNGSRRPDPRDIDWNGHSR
jgi:GGDEF domain-containing protein